ncbi:hypothetical protein J6590_087878 [Homalodisca vitripennis]|nr:hypothetical protein J6590_087878 [Homalodisca vitripennis]
MIQCRVQHEVWAPSSKRNSETREYVRGDVSGVKTEHSERETTTEDDPNVCIDVFCQGLGTEKLLSFISDKSIFWMGKIGGRGRLLTRSTRKNLGHQFQVTPSSNYPLQSKQGQVHLTLRERTPSTPTVISRSRLDLSNYPCTPED